MTPVLNTERLTLRGWKPSDFDAYAAFVTDPAMAQFIGGSSKSPAQAWLVFTAISGEWALRGYGTFAIEAKDTGALAGYAGLWHPIDLEEPELCWGLFKEFHGKGYATEAARCVQDWAANDLNLPALMSFVHPNNAASIKVAERLGATCQGETELRGMPRLFFRHRLPEADPIPQSA